MPDTYRKRRRLIAVGASLVVPGGGHFYTGQTRRAVVLVVLYALALATMIAGASGARGVGLVGLVAFVTVVLMDQVGAQRAITRVRPRGCGS
ncbi:MAG: hypothetical protein RKU31_16005 [Deltaproteobacteria bacterium]